MFSGYEDFERVIGYESPITQIIGQLETQMEDECMKVVQQCGFDVDKYELARALAYDRDQYDKGYDDGYTKAIDDFFEKIMEYCSMSNMNRTMIRQLAEQLKEGGLNG